MNYKELREEVRQLVGQNEVEKALDRLYHYCEQQDLKDEVMVQTGRYRQFSQDRRQGIIDHDQFYRLTNPLRDSILKFVRELETTAKAQTEPDYRKVFQLSHARYRVAELLMKSKTGEGKGLVINEIQEKGGITNRKYVIHSIRELEKNGLVRKDRVNGLTHYTLNDQGQKLLEKFKMS